MTVLLYFPHASFVLVPQCKQSLSCYAVYFLGLYNRHFPGAMEPRYFRLELPVGTHSTSSNMTFQRIIPVSMT